MDTAHWHTGMHFLATCCCTGSRIQCIITGRQVLFASHTNPQVVHQCRPSLSAAGSPVAQQGRCCHCHACVNTNTTSNEPTNTCTTCWAAFIWVHACSAPPSPNPQNVVNQLRTPARTSKPLSSNPDHTRHESGSGCCGAVPCSHTQHPTYAVTV